MKQNKHEKLVDTYAVRYDSLNGMTLKRAIEILENHRDFLFSGFPGIPFKFTLDEYNEAIDTVVKHLKK